MRRIISVVKKCILIVVWLIIAAGFYYFSEEYTELGKEENIDRNKQIEEKVSTEVLIEEEKDVEESIDKNIRVLIKTSNFESIYHDSICISGTDRYKVIVGDKVEVYEAGTEYVLDDKVYEVNNVSKISIEPEGDAKICLKSVERNVKAEYKGKFECYRTDDGLILVNELAIEEYLQGVVPSEMPSKYPIEALKAQAISARTYTYYHKKEYAYPKWEAHVDDSTTFQVYMNTTENENTSRAVSETKDMVITKNGDIVQSFYYSTSSGYNGGSSVWGNDTSADYLKETGEEIFGQNNAEGEKSYQEYIDKGNQTHIEYNEPWYRWNYKVELNTQNVQKILSKIYKMSLTDNTNIKIRSKDMQTKLLEKETYIKDIRILNREKSGVITSIMISTCHFNINIRTQHCIRQVFAISGEHVYKKDGSEYTLGDILPSAYFYIDKTVNDLVDDNQTEDSDKTSISYITVCGGGMGHGAGMSQNGAKCLAQKGYVATEILKYYYDGEIEVIK